MKLEDDRFWKLIAGKDDALAAPEERRFAALVREAVRAQEDPSPEDLNIEAGLQRLTEAMDRIDAQRRRQRAPWFRRFLDWFGGLGVVPVASAAVLVLAVGLIEYQLAIEEPRTAVIRDNMAPARGYVAVADPVKQQAELVQELTAKGIEARALPEKDGTWVVQATLPSVVDEGLHALLARHGIETTRGGDIDIGFVRKQ